MPSRPRCGHPVTSRPIPPPLCDTTTPRHPNQRGHTAAFDWESKRAGLGRQPQRVRLPSRSRELGESGGVSSRAGSSLGRCGPVGHERGAICGVLRALSRWSRLLPGRGGDGARRTWGIARAGDFTPDLRAIWKVFPGSFPDAAALNFAVRKSASIITRVEFSLRSLEAPTS